MTELRIGLDYVRNFYNTSFFKNIRLFGNKDGYSIHFWEFDIFLDFIVLKNNIFFEQKMALVTLHHQPVELPSEIYLKHLVSIITPMVHFIDTIKETSKVNTVIFYNNQNFPLNYKR